jgi:hypothetical protein
MHRPPSITGIDMRLSGLVAAVALLLAGLCVLPGARAAGQLPPVGKVTFALGPAQIVAADAVARPVQTGAAVHEGEQLVTGPDGWLHLRMVDDAFVALRPGSTLRIERYAFDAARPAASQIRLHLIEGNSRTVSGKGGEAARQHYRFSTPLAAIGLRGTDYTVRVFDDVTRVSVRRGAVSVTPLGEGCSAEGPGPCNTALTRELTADLPHAYLELSAKNPAPVLVLPEQDPHGAAQQNPPSSPHEPEAKSGTDSRPAVAPTATVGEVIADRVVDAGSAVAQLPPPAPPPPAALVWGRWSRWAQGPGAPAITSLLGPDREVREGNDMFGLLRSTNGPLALPTQGVVDFQLANSEVYAVSGSSAQAAQVLGGNFGIDFRQRTFQTSLAVQYPGGRESLRAAGDVQFQGQLIADPARSTMNLLGSLSRDGAEAAYLFDKPIDGGKLLGAVRWLH